MIQCSEPVKCFIVIIIITIIIVVVIIIINNTRAGTDIKTFLVG